MIEDAAPIMGPSIPDIAPPEVDGRPKSFAECRAERLTISLTSPHLAM
jgi:hypothetical protein